MEVQSLVQKLLMRKMEIRKNLLPAFHPLFLNKSLGPNKTRQRDDTQSIMPADHVARSANHARLSQEPGN